MKVKQDSKLAINKTTVCRLTDWELAMLMAGEECMPPSMLGESCPAVGCGLDPGAALALTSKC